MLELRGCLTHMDGIWMLLNAAVSGVLVWYFPDNESYLKPPFFFREFHYFCLFIAFAYNAGRFVHAAVTNDILMIQSLGRLVGCSIQIIDHQWLCKNWIEIFVEHKFGRVYLWIRALTLPYIFFCLSSFFHLENITDIIVNSLDVLILFVLIYWYETRANGLYANRYILIRNNCLFSVVTAGISMGFVDVDAILSKLITIVILLIIAGVMHYTLVMERRESKRIIVCIEESSKKNSIISKKNSLISKSNSNVDVNNNSIVDVNNNNAGDNDSINDNKQDDDELILIQQSDTNNTNNVLELNSVVEECRPDLKHSEKIVINRNEEDNRVEPFQRLRSNDLEIGLVNIAADNNDDNNVVDPRKQSMFRHIKHRSKIMNHGDKAAAIMGQCCIIYIVSAITELALGYSYPVKWCESFNYSNASWDIPQVILDALTR